jgi:hypothetical protein
MKLKNHYAWLLPFWLIATICDSLACVVNFVEGNLAVGFIFLILSVAFAFVSGILLEKALEIHNHNKEVDWLHEIAQELQEEQISKIKPFEEFEND